MTTKEKSMKSDSKAKKKSGNTKVKTVREHVRHLKSGKVVKVRKYQAEYEAADELAKAMSQKEGAGKELEALKKKGAGDKLEQRKLDEEWKKIEDAYLEKHPDFEAFDEEGNETKENAALTKKMEAFMKKHPSWKGGVMSSPKIPKEKSEKASKVKKETESASHDYGFTADDYKAWYHWDQDADPKNAAAKKVEKALKKQMGTKAYNKYFDELTDNYSARGHNKAFKGLDDALDSINTSKKAAKLGADFDKAMTAYSKNMPKSMTIDEAIAYHKKNSPRKDLDGQKITITKEDEKKLREYLSGERTMNVAPNLEKLKKAVSSTKETTPKVGEKVKLANWMDGAQKKKSFEVIGVQKATKEDNKNSELSNWVWVKDSKGKVYAATQFKDGGIGIDSTWTDFTDNKKHPYEKSLKNAGYSLSKDNGYWEVSSLGRTTTEGDKRRTSSKSTGSELSGEKVGSGIAFKNNKAGQAWAKKNGEPVVPFGKEGGTYYKVGNDLYGNITGGHGGTIWGKVDSSKAKKLLKYSEDDRKRKDLLKNPIIPTSSSARASLYKMLTSKDTKLWNVPDKYRGLFTDYGNPNSKGNAFIKEFKASKIKATSERLKNKNFRDNYTVTPGGRVVRKVTSSEWASNMQKKYSGSTGRNAEVRSLLGVSYSMRIAPTGYTKGAIQTAIRELKKTGDTKKVKSLEKLLEQKEKSKSKTSKKNAKEIANNRKNRKPKK